MTAATPASQSERTLVITRVLDAPRKTVFAAWTRAGHLVNWWGPKDFTVPFCEMDARVDGQYRACIRSPEGADYWMRGIFREVSEPSRLVFTWAWEGDPDEEGPDKESNGKPGHETLITLTFEAQGQKTLMTFRQEIFESVDERDSHEDGWTECFDRLGTYLGKLKAQG